MFIVKNDLIYYKICTNKMDTNQNTDPDFYIKKIEDDNHREYNVFFVNKDVPLTDEILQEMAKYEIVEFCDSFNQLICNLPEGLQNLTFGRHFNYPVDHLPSGLQNLTFGSNFTQTLSDLPSGLKSLKMSKKYRKTIDNLPVSVEIIRY